MQESKLKTGVLIVEGLGAIISLGIGIYQVVTIIQDIKAKKAATKQLEKASAIDATAE